MAIPTATNTYNTPQRRVDQAIAQVDGQLAFTMLDPVTTATSATEGSADALPAAPAGYALVYIGGTLAKVPFYAV